MAYNPKVRYGHQSLAYDARNDLRLPSYRNTPRNWPVAVLGLALGLIVCMVML